MKNTNSDKYYKRWKLYAPLGLMIIGLGVSIVAEAAMLKYDDTIWWKWVGLGTLGLVILNSGVSVVGEAVLYRARYERALEH